MSEILHRGIQWVVYADGIEAPNEGGYWIEGPRIDGVRDGFIDWCLHLAEKEWVHLTDFEAAYRFAAAQWCPNLDPVLIDRSFAEARSIRDMDENPHDPPPERPLAMPRATGRPRRRAR